MCGRCGLPPFRYSLPLQEFGFSLRVIKLHPARLPDADIVIDLGVDNEETLSYEAVSWCWGDGGWHSPIRVRCENGDFCFQISENLDRALRTLRYRDRYRTLWIDSVCIDQQNLKERSRQVPMMSEIYRRATQVSIWLGDEEAISRRAIRFVKEHLLHLDEFDALCTNPRYDEDWMALIQFTERAWFSRRWVIQEIALAKQKAANVLCGTDEIIWDDFAEAIVLLDHALSNPSLSRLFVQSTDWTMHNRRSAPALGAIRLVKASNELFRASSDGRPIPTRSLEYLVTTFAMFETSDPRDVVYALLSISRDAFRWNPSADQQTQEAFSSNGLTSSTQKAILAWWTRHTAREAFLVDYEIPTVAVYKRFISFCISKAGPNHNLDILCRPWAPEPRSADEKYPSWICKLTNSSHTLVEQTTVGKRLVRRNADSLVGPAGLPRYSASTQPGPSKGASVFKFYESVSRSMFLGGFILDEINKVELPSQLGHIPPEWPKMGGWHDMKGPPPDEFWRTLVANRSPDGGDPLPFYHRACKDVFKNFINDTLDTSFLIAQGSTVVSDFLVRVQSVVWNRRLMRTNRGWLGLVPKEARQGDLICILHGCSVPTVLRRRDKTSEDLSVEAKDEEKRRDNVVEYIARIILERHRSKQAARQAVAAALQRSLVRDVSHITPRPVNVFDFLVDSTNAANQSDVADSPAGQLHTKQEERFTPLPVLVSAPRTRARSRCRSSTSDEENQPLKRMKTTKRMKRDHAMSIHGHLRHAVYYSLLGECYVHDMMDGQAARFKKNSAGEIQEQVFEIR